MKTKTLLIIIIIILIQENCLPNNFWEKISGTEGGISSIIKGKRDTLYASFDDYCEFLIISTDNGKSWINLEIDSSSYHILSLSRNSNNNYLFAGTENDGILRSTNNGKTWHRIAVDSIRDCVPSIFADSIGNVYVVECFTKVWHSPDNGETWEKLYENDSISSLHYNSFRINKKDYFYAIFSRKLYCSKDNGYIWNWLNKFEDSLDIYEIFIDKNDDIYVGGSTLYKSTDEGNSWFKIKVFDNLGIVVLIHIENNQIIVGASHIDGEKIYLSNDKGNSWIDVTIGLTEEVKLLSEIVQTNDDYLLLGTYYDGIYRSSSKFLDVESKDNEIVEFIISPNPASDYISFSDIPDNISVISIYTVMGIKVLESKVNDNRIDISTLSSGIYFLKIKDRVLNFVKL